MIFLATLIDNFSTGHNIPCRKAEYQCCSALILYFLSLRDFSSTVPFGIIVPLKSFSQFGRPRRSRCNYTGKPSFLKCHSTGVAQARTLRRRSRLQGTSPKGFEHGGFVLDMLGHRLFTISEPKACTGSVCERIPPTFDLTNIAKINSTPNLPA